MKSVFYLGYLLTMLFIVLAVELLNLACNAMSGKKPIKRFRL